LEEKLRDAQIQIEGLKWTNQALEEQLLRCKKGKYVGKRDTVKVKPRGAKCLVLGDSIVRNVGAGKTNTRVECFPGIRADQLRGTEGEKKLGMCRYCCNSCRVKLSQKV
jgi:hypothetical protein